MRDQLRVDNLERVDREDFEFLAQESPTTHAQDLPANFLTNPAGQRAWIVDGFDMAVVAGPSGQLGVTRGTAILSFREKGVIEHGAVVTQGETQRIQDLSAFANGVYNIYIRFQFQQGDFQNRVFWNPNANVEFPQNIATKRTANWGLRVALSAPGGEWFKIGEATVAAGLITLITKQRQFYFEGDEDNSFALGWGGGLDRDADRALNGVRDLHTAVDALLKKVEEIQTGGNPNIIGERWWDAPVNGSLDAMLPLVGSSGVPTRMRGDIEPDATGQNRNLGDVAQRWGTVHTQNLEVTDVLPIGASSLGLDVGGSRFAAGFFDDLTVDSMFTVRGTSTFNDNVLLSENSPSLTLANQAASGGLTGIFLIDQGGGGGFLDIILFQDAGRTQLEVNNTFRVRAGFTDVLDIVSTGMHPAAGVPTLGLTGNRWSAIYADSLYLTNGLNQGVRTDLVPGVHNSLDLGSINRFFRELHVVRINGASDTLLPNTNTQTIGSNVDPWGGMFAALEVRFTEASARLSWYQGAGGTPLLSVTNTVAGTLEIDGTFEPSTDGGQVLGATNYWGQVNTEFLDLGGSGGGFSAPSTNNGVATTRWSNGAAMKFQTAAGADYWANFTTVDGTVVVAEGGAVTLVAVTEFIAVRIPGATRYLRLWRT